MHFFFRYCSVHAPSAAFGLSNSPSVMNVRFGFRYSVVPQIDWRWWWNLDLGRISRTRLALASGFITYLPFDTLSRRRRDGDRFRPAWRDRPAKLKDFLRGQGVPLHRRDEVALICDQHDEVSLGAQHERCFHHKYFPLWLLLAVVATSMCTVGLIRFLPLARRTSLAPSVSAFCRSLVLYVKVIAVYPCYPGLEYCQDRTSARPLRIRVEGTPLFCPRPEDRGGVPA